MEVKAETEGQRCAAVNMYKDLLYHHTLKFPDQHQKKPTAQKSARAHAFSPCLFLHLSEKSTQDGDPSFFDDILFSCLQNYFQRTYSSLLRDNFETNTHSFSKQLKIKHKSFISKVLLLFHKCSSYFGQHSISLVLQLCPKPNIKIVSVDRKPDQNSISLDIVMVVQLETDPSNRVFCI